MTNDLTDCVTNSLILYICMMLNIWRINYLNWYCFTELPIANGAAVTKIITANWKSVLYV